MQEFSPTIEALLSGKSDEVLSRFSGEPKVNAQVGGAISGADAVAAWVVETGKWFESLSGKWHGGLDIVGERLVHDASLSITTKDGEVDLPFVVVADHDGENIVELRTYHSTWPYTFGHVFREPPVAKGDLSKLPKVFFDYIDRLGRSDVDSILASFTVDAYVREPSGNRYKYQGQAERDGFYKGHIADAPPARFDLRTCTNGPNITAVEYAFAYGDVPLVGGICIMEYEGDKIRAVRITDDVGAE